MAEHESPECTGTWMLEAAGGEQAALRCSRCAARYEATAERSLAAVRENLLSISLLVMGLAGRQA
jgi:hypothetical protein